MATTALHPALRAGMRAWRWLPLQALCYVAITVLTVLVAEVRIWDVYTMHRAGDPSPWWLAVPFAASLLVLSKRRAPALGLLAATVLFLVDLATMNSLTPVLVLLDLLHAYVVRLPAPGRRRVLVAVIAFVAALTLAAGIIAGGVEVMVVLGLQLGALFGFSFWYANSLAQSQELVALYRQRADDLERLADLDRAAAVRDERERMARELHDVVSGHVVAVAIRSEAALAAGDLTGAEPSPDREALRAVRDASLDAHAELRAMISMLREERGAARAPGRPSDGGAPGDAAPDGHGPREEGAAYMLSRGRATIGAAAERARRAGLAVDVVDELDGPVAAATDHAIGRIVHEALTNAAKHAAGAAAQVAVTGDAETVEVCIVNSRGRAAGSGLTGNGLGLAMLAERAAALGGAFTAGPETADGHPVWAVRARIPRRPDARAGTAATIARERGRG